MMAKKTPNLHTNPEFPMNSAQKEAAEADRAPLLIVAGAGTGKTKTLTSRIIHLIHTGIRPERICAITFTNKAAKEMARRTGSPESFIGTFHALGAKILRKECRHVGREPNFTIFDDHDSFELVKKATWAVLPKPKRGEPIDRKSKELSPVFFAQKISAIKNIGLADPKSDRESEKNELARKISEKYEAALVRNNAFDFDDLIEKVVAIFKSHPEVLKKYQNMFDAVLVDEYQDINPKQYELVSLLAGVHRNLSVVGDDEQTIYSWRYADIRTFLDFDKKWKGAKVYFLEENYRSTGTIIRAASGVAKNNRFRTPKNLWTQNPEGDPITLFEAWGENEEAEWIAQEIQKLRAPDKNAEIGILYRTNAQSRAIEQALIRRDIPYRIFGGLKFYERREVKDAVAALRYIANEKDELAQDRLEKNLTKRKFAQFRNNVLATAVTRTAPMKPIDALKLFIETFGYFEYLESNFINADEREENVAELIAFASEFESLDMLLERLSLLQAADEMGNKKDDGAAVNMMTIHLAKGLEFDTVFIAGAAEGFLPHGRSLDKEDSLEEERRLMYVAMTRARKRLLLSFYGIPSRFISEIPEDLVVLAEENGGGNYEGDGKSGSKNKHDGFGDHDDSYDDEASVTLD
jgi:DNA helicase II / ATP-dependent DNA helicase PcrA